MKILVTGGCGFIGSNYVIRQVIKRRNKVLNIDSLTYAGNIENLSILNDNVNYTFVHGDISDIKCLNKAFRDFNPDVVVHFAAESHVDRSIDDPLIFVKTNLVGTATLLQASLEHWKNTKNNFRFIHVSTDEVFGSINDKSLFTESTPYNPSSPYSASKAGSDFLVKAWQKTYNLPAIVTNCSNNYGPYQFPEKLIPLIIINCLNERPLPIYGNGKNIRDWLFVDDHCTALDIIIENGKIGETYNFGGNNQTSNIDIVNKICEILDEKKPLKSSKSYKALITYVKDRPGHDFKYAIDTSKMKNDFNWKPKEDLESGIRKTINWYLKNEKWWRKIQKKIYHQERLGLEN
jgi:dTDP-glucose 4,6-dehydratase